MNFLAIFIFINTLYKNIFWKWFKNALPTSVEWEVIKSTGWISEIWKEVSELSSEVLFVSVLAMVLSEYWKRLEENFRNKIISAISQNDRNYKKIFSPAFFNILKEPLLLQRQTLYQQKALDLGYLEPEGKGRGCIMGVSRSFGAKSIYCWFFTGAKMVFDSLPSRRSLGN